MTVHYVFISLYRVEVTEEVGEIDRVCHTYLCTHHIHSHKKKCCSTQVTEKQRSFIPRRAAARRRTRRAGGVFEVWTPPLTRLLGHVATRGKRHSQERQKSWRSCYSHFGFIQKSCHQRSPKVKFCRFQHFSTNWHITWEAKELQRRRKAHSIALLPFFRYLALIFDLRSTVWPSESKNS